jgi:hypothetical protein
MSEKLNDRIRAKAQEIYEYRKANELEGDEKSDWKQAQQMIEHEEWLKARKDWH